ncbi:MAG: helicase-related protein [Phycisphaerae bacterium]
MPQIFDNIELYLLPTLQKAMELSRHADFCVGYFNLRGWRHIDQYVEQWSGGDGNCCRLLVGMHRPAEDQLLRTATLPNPADEMDNANAKRLQKRLAEEFRDQLTLGAPTDADEAGLRRLARQIRTGKLQVKLFLKHPLHAKLYLLQRADPLNPKIGFLGSSNLTMAGLSRQGELNVDITDADAWDKLAKWFMDRWNDRFCIDISQELIEIIGSSWAREIQPPPYHIYLKMAYHLAAEARLSEEEYDIPDEFGSKLMDFQIAAVKMAVRIIDRHGGVMIGDVVGLGKTLVGSAIAKVLQEQKNHETLILCPKNLCTMWENYRIRYAVNAKVVPLSMAHRELRDMTRFRTVLIDESHNLRNRETAAYKAIRDYIERNASQVILLTATPYNKTLLDLSSQLRLFLDPETQLAVRPEHFIRTRGLEVLSAQTQADPHTIVAFEKSDLAEDWRILMDQFLIRRTRGWIKRNKGKVDPTNGRSYLQFTNGKRSYFPDRIPKSVKFAINEKDPQDQYARMFGDDTVNAINTLHLPRYGLGNYVKIGLYLPDRKKEHEELIRDLSRAGKHLIGFCRTGLFKRLESSGAAFELTMDRHILRDKVALHALQNGLDVPIGSSDAAIFETGINDADALLDFADESADNAVPGGDAPDEIAELYARFKANNRYRWLPAAFFDAPLADHLQQDIAALENIRRDIGQWNPRRDNKLRELTNLLQNSHGREKVLIFTQFADTANYLYRQLKQADVRNLAVVTGDSDNPTALAHRFSPQSNQKQMAPADELRVLVSTDVLSEGQNLQDCAIIVNYDLPWALIRIIQRVGRVDRIGQTSHQILCYSFLPADGVERIIRLHQRIRQRQRQEGEVIGADEMLIEGDPIAELELFKTLYNENSRILEQEDESDVDLPSYAYQIWQDAVKDNPALAKTIEDLPNVIYSTRPHLAPGIAAARTASPNPAAGIVPARSDHTIATSEGVITFVQTGQGNNSLIFLNQQQQIVTESPLEILQAAQCTPDTLPAERLPQHHGLVGKALELAAKDQNRVGGQLGGRRSVRRKVYDRLKSLHARTANSLFRPADLDKVLDDIYRYPLKQSAQDLLVRRIKEGIDDDALTQLAVDLRSENQLCNITEDPNDLTPKIICSLGMRHA